MAADVEPQVQEKASPSPRGRRTALLLGGVAGLMFAFGFALAPLYSLLCDAIGIQSASAEVARVAASGEAPPQQRVVTVRFDTNVPADLPWEFSADLARIELHPGQLTTVKFHVRNRSGETIIGRAIPTVVPWQAGPHFNKTECFCFQDQAVAPGESKELIVRFMVSPKLPEDIDALTLSYTFLRHATEPQAGAALVPNNSRG